MVRTKISVGRRWIPRLFPGWSGPEQVDDVVTMTTPWEGTGRYTDLIFQAQSAVDAAIVLSSVVPGDRQWWVPYCMLYHTDGALTSHAWIDIRDRAGNAVAVAGSPDATTQRRVSIRRPLIIPEGGRITGNLATTTAGGADMKLRFFFVETTLGEFIPAI